MATANAAAIRLVSAEPRDAVAMFQRRGELAPTFRWDDLWREEHSRAFMVAGVAQADVLRLISDSLQQALASGTSLADWSKAITPQLVKKGWWGDVEITDPQTGEIRVGRFNQARLQLIYDVNLRQSYAAGRWARAQRTRRAKPLLLYRTMRDERVRQSHQRWDGVALPIDHPFWATHYPPNGWRCRCRAVPMSERDLQRLRDAGQRITTEAPPVETVAVRTQPDGPVHQVPVGIDPGWDYNPGQASLAHAGQLSRQALDGLPQPLAAASVRTSVASRAFETLLAKPLPGLHMPVAVSPAARQLGATSPTVVVRGDDLANPNAELATDASDYQWVQATLQSGQRVPERLSPATWLLRRGGRVALVQLQVVDDVASLRRLRVLTSDQADDDDEVGPLLRGLGG